MCNANCIFPCNNKSQLRQDTYYKESGDFSTKILNFSLDDFIDAFIDINNHKYSSIFENTTFLYLKQLHETYGLKVTCYVFYEKGPFKLSNCTDRYRSEFIANSSWLKFGFHQNDGDSFIRLTGKLLPYYNKTMRQLIRIVGLPSVDQVMRLDRFYGTFEDIKLMSQAFPIRIKGLLTSDDQRRSYYLLDRLNLYIYSHDKMKDEDLNITFYSTDLRIELISNINEKIKELKTDAWNNQRDLMCIFTHERMLANVNIRENLESMLRYFFHERYSYSFLDDL